MRTVKIFLTVLACVLILWIDFPENLRVTVPFTKNTYTLNPPSFKIFTFQKDFKTHLGLDLKGGSHLVFEADTSKVAKSDLEDALNSAKDIVEKRVNFFGVSEPTVQTLKSDKNYRIAVDLPGIGNSQEAIRLIGETAQLEFTEENPDVKLATGEPSLFKLTKPTGLTGRDVKKATVTFNPQTGEPQVSLAFSANGTKKFSEITSRNIGKQVGIFIDKTPVSAPVVQQAITDGNPVITGNFDVDTAKKLAIAINSGALPVPIKLIEQRNIGATLGDIEVRKSVYAGLAGISFVMLFMMLYYGRLGFIACLSLIIYGLLTFALFRTVPVVLTLPGVAGFLLSIGMAVDTNILIFERIKEELRKGRDPHIALRLGFGRALDAIKDANITTLIVAFVLFNPLNWDFLPQFGLVRGFALTLAIGVITSLFTGLVITKRLLTIFYKSKRSL